MTREQILAAQRIGAVVLETIQDAGELGAPSGVIYAALQTQGCTLNQYQSLLAPLVSRGFVVNDDHSLTMTSAGKAFLPKLKASIANQEKAAA